MSENELNELQLIGKNRLPLIGQEYEDKRVTNPKRRNGMTDLRTMYYEEVQENDRLKKQIEAATKILLPALGFRWVSDKKNSRWTKP